MARILKATATAGAKALKLSSSTAKDVRGKLECLSKGSSGKGVGKEAPPRTDKGKEARGKEKVPNEPQKKRSWVHSSGSSTIKFGTTVSHSSKADPPPRRRRRQRL